MGLIPFSEEHYMNLLNLIGFLSGLALFLYGVALMGDGLSKVAGDKLQKILYQGLPWHLHPDQL